MAWIGTSADTKGGGKADEAEALEIARTLNEDRRAMPKAERLEVVKALREDGHSERAIAGALGVSPATVHRDVSGASHEAHPAVTGLDGKTYPARKQPRPPERDALKLAAEINRQRLEDRRERHLEEGRTLHSQ